jgi:tRNA pseudouridine38-40 synthase
MSRYKLIIEYDGTAYAGWQRQANAMSIQQVLEDGLQRLTGQAVAVRGAGRTDAGVHALAQVAHIDMPRDWSETVVRDALNAQIRPHPIAVLQVDRVAAGFDARFSAIRRHYLYRIVNRRAPLALDSGRAWLIRPRLDPDAMQAGARHLIGRHDFSTFRDSECQADSPVRTLEGLDVCVAPGEEIHIRAVARSFLHRQVRSIVGSLALVGSGKWSPGDLQRALERRDRSACGTVAPAAGLYLFAVDYPGASLPGRTVDEGADASLQTQTLSA